MSEYIPRYSDLRIEQHGPRGWWYVMDAHGELDGPYSTRMDAVSVAARIAHVEPDHRRQLYP